MKGEPPTDPDATVDVRSSDPHASTLDVPALREAAPVTVGSPDERYLIAEEVGRGGLGRIVRAWDRRLERPIAVKQLLKRHGSSEVRFLREALLTARLEHPAIMPVHDASPPAPRAS